MPVPCFSSSRCGENRGGGQCWVMHFPKPFSHVPNPGGEIFFKSKQKETNGFHSCALRQACEEIIQTFNPKPRPQSGMRMTRTEASRPHIAVCGPRAGGLPVPHLPQRRPGRHGDRAVRPPVLQRGPPVAVAAPPRFSAAASLTSEGHPHLDSQVRVRTRASFPRGVGAPRFWYPKSSLHVMLPSFSHRRHIYLWHMFWGFGEVSVPDSGCQERKG